MQLILRSQLLSDNSNINNLKRIYLKNFFSDVSEKNHQLQNF